MSAFSLNTHQSLAKPSHMVCTLENTFDNKSEKNKLSTFTYCEKKSQIKENAPSVKTNRCHRRSINLGKWSCTINWDKLVKV